MKPRHHLYLDTELTQQLDAFAAKPGSSKSAIVADALRQYLNPKTDTDNSHAIKMRLDRLSKQVNRAERNLNIVVESISGFAQYYFMLTAHVPSPDDAGRAKGSQRYEKYLSYVGSLVAKSGAANNSGLAQKVEQAS